MTGGSIQNGCIMFINGINSEFCCCFSIPIQVDFRHRFRGSISVMAQCIEIKLKPNESPGKDL